VTRTRAALIGLTTEKTSRQPFGENPIATASAASRVIIDRSFSGENGSAVVRDLHRGAIYHCHGSTYSRDEQYSGEGCLTNVPRLNESGAFRFFWRFSPPTLARRLAYLIDGVQYVRTRVSSRVVFLVNEVQAGGVCLLSQWLVNTEEARGFV
jgi:hypothetical protein